jgi:hypothetical protein
MDIRYIRDVIFFFLVFALAFPDIPRFLQIPLISGPLVSRAVFYPLIMAFIFTVIWRHKSKDLFVNLDPFKRYFFVTLTVLLVSEIIGLFQYPYEEFIFSHLTNLPLHYAKAVNLFHMVGIEISSKKIVGASFIIKNIKNLVLGTFFSLGCSYIIYCWYRNDVRRAFSIMYKALVFLVSLITIYCVIEMIYLSGNPFAGDLLTLINPYLHNIASEGGWHPPLLWRGQMRAIFDEPSYLGIFASFAFPVFWLFFYKETRKIHLAFLWILQVCLAIMLFLSQARTGIFLFMVEILIYTIGLIVFYRYGSSKATILKRSVLICIGFLMAFGFSNYFINYQLIPRINRFEDTKARVATADILRSDFDKYGLRLLGKSAFSSNNFHDKRTNINKKQNKYSTEANAGKLGAENQLGTKGYLENNLFSLSDSNARSNKTRYTYMMADLRLGMTNPLLGVGPGLRSGYITMYLEGEKGLNSELLDNMKKVKEKGTLSQVYAYLGDYTIRFSESGLLGLISFLFPIYFLFILSFNYIKNICWKKLVLESWLYHLTFNTILGAILLSGFSVNFTIIFILWIFLGVGYALYFPNPIKKELGDNIFGS